ncbi:glycosyltransferase family 2 protein [Variovorax sp. ZT4R33]|uniref:glycosyltransferase family 2 protein n=1 Tax=Variovorax sp. ZT4R33 TaxID=3443743 RepID=UPI003F488EA3
MPEATRARPTLTIGVLAKNEAHRIEACLRSATFADQLLLVDSGSTDDTVARAEAAGATVVAYPDWQGFGVQRTRLLAHVRSDYIFFLDADEVVTPELRTSIEAAVASGEAGVWRVRWRMVAYGHELKAYRAGGPERLFRRDTVSSFEGAVHEEAVLLPAFVDVPRHVLSGKLLHHSWQTVRGSLEKLTQYAMLGAAKRAALGKRGGVLRGMAGGTAMFVRFYFLRLGFLCGGAGFLFCFFVSLEAFFRYAALHYDREQLSNQVGR